MAWAEIYDSTNHGSGMGTRSKIDMSLSAVPCKPFVYQISRVYRDTRLLYLYIMGNRYHLSRSESGAYRASILGDMDHECKKVVQRDGDPISFCNTDDFINAIPSKPIKSSSCKALWIFSGFYIARAYNIQIRSERKDDARLTAMVGIIKCHGSITRLSNLVVDVDMDEGKLMWRGEPLKAWNSQYIYEEILDRIKEIGLY